MRTAKEVLSEIFRTDPDLLDTSAHCRVYSAIEAMEEYAAQFKPTWIKITSETDLPKQCDNYWFMLEDGYFFCGMYSSIYKAFRADKTRIYKWEEISHYAPIAKPEPPKQ